MDSTPGITTTLKKIFSLPKLECLDLLDTRLPSCQDDPDVMHQLLRLLPQLVEFYSSDLTTHVPVFDILAQSLKLTAMYLDLTTTHQRHYELPDIAERLRDAFLPLQRLVLHCVGARARDFVELIARSLQSCDLRIDGPLDVDDLGEITASLRASIPTLRILRCSTSLHAKSDVHNSLYQCLTPLLQMTRMQKVVLSFTMLGSSMFHDNQVDEMFHAWPKLLVFSIEIDPDDDTPINSDDPQGYGLTLTSLLTIHHCCPELYELSLPYIDTSDIPIRSAIEFTQSVIPFEIHLSRCHAHKRRDVRQFIQKIWAKAESSFEDCLCGDMELDR